MKEKSKMRRIFLLSSILPAFIGLVFFQHMILVYGNPAIDLWASLSTQITLPPNARVGWGGNNPLIETFQGTWIFVNTTTAGKVWRSTDQGSSWTMVKDLGTCNPTSHNGVILTVDNWIILPVSQTGNPVWVSKDDGLTWIKADKGFLPLPQNWVQLSNKTVYVGQWGSNSLVWKSDNALNWTLAWNFTQILLSTGFVKGARDHMHQLSFDNYRNRWYASFGDSWTGNGWISKGTLYSEDDGKTWKNANNGGPISRVTTPFATFFGGDQDGTDVWYVNESGQIKLLDAFRTNDLRVYSHGAFYANGVTYIEASGSGSFHHWGIIVSPDNGKTWGRLLYSAVREQLGCDIFYWGTSNYFYVTCAGANDRIFRVRLLTQSQAVWLVQKNHITVDGSLFTYEETLGNGTTQLNFGGYAISDANVTLQGVSYKNWLNNSGFDTGDTGGWAVSTGASIESSIVHDGPKSLKYVSPISAKSISQSYLPYGNGTSVAVSIWAKANTTSIKNCRIYINWGSGSSFTYSTFSVNTTWQRFQLAWHLGSGTVGDTATQCKFRVDILAPQPNATFYFDSAMMSIGYPQFDAHPTKNLDSMEHEGWFNGIFNTTNPSVAFDSQVFSHAGTLLNGQNGSTQDFAQTGGTMSVSVTVMSSGMVKIKIQGKLTFTATDCLITLKSGNAWAGNYYSTFPSFTGNTLVVLTSRFAEISSIDYDESTMTLIVNSDTGLTSTTKAYVGNEGEPKGVWVRNGVLVQDYNASTNILTLNVTHYGPAEIIVDWRMPGDVNGDGVVDANDLTRINRSYGSKPEQLKWDTQADLNRDDLIDCRDLLIVGKHYEDIGS